MLRSALCWGTCGCIGIKGGTGRGCWGKTKLLYGVLATWGFAGRLDEVANMIVSRDQKDFQELSYRDLEWVEVLAC